MRATPTLQALVYDILPSTTAVFSYPIRSRKLSANEQFFVGAQTVVSLLQTTHTHTPSITFRHLPPKEGCRKPVLGDWATPSRNACLGITEDGGCDHVLCSACKCWHCVAVFGCCFYFTVGLVRVLVLGSLVNQVYNIVHATGTHTCTDVHTHTHGNVH